MDDLLPLINLIETSKWIFKSLKNTFNPFIALLPLAASALEPVTFDADFLNSASNNGRTGQKRRIYLAPRESCKNQHLSGLLGT